MTTSQTIAPPATTPTASGAFARLRAVGPTGIVVAVVLSVFEWTLVRDPGNAGSVLAALLALTMTLPVALARRRPVAAAAIIAGAAVVNGLAFPELVRCGGAFPAALYVALVVGAYAWKGGSILPAAAGLVLAVGNLVAQWAWDPALSVDPGFLTFGPPLALLAWGLGLGVSALRRRRATR